MIAVGADTKPLAATWALDLSDRMAYVEQVLAQPRAPAAGTPHPDTSSRPPANTLSPAVQLDIDVRVCSEDDPMRTSRRHEGAAFSLPFGRC
jgi:hypothetical protein